MARKRGSSKPPIWKPSDIAKATAAAAMVGDKPLDALEVGARAIYEMRPHPKKLRWDQALPQVRADHVAKMQALVTAIRAEGFVIRGRQTACAQR